MDRHTLPDSDWERILPLLPREANGRGCPAKKGDRNFIEAVVWMMRTGAPWRDLHPRFGPYTTIYNRFRRWAMKDHWKAIFAAIKIDEKPGGTMADGTIARAHQHSAGGKGGSTETP